MGKITINAVLTMLRLCASLVSKLIRICYAVMDLVDDGCINASIARPDWMITLSSVINALESISGHVSSMEDEVYKSSVASNGSQN